MTIEQAAERAAEQIAEITTVPVEVVRLIVLDHYQRVNRHQSGLVGIYHRALQARDVEINALRERVAAVEFRLAEMEGAPMLRFMEAPND